MKARIKNYLIKTKKNIVYKRARNLLLNKDFTIISNNCWGGHVYQDLNLEYKSPFVGMFLYAPCYAKLLQNLDHYMGQELVFASHSKYERAESHRARRYYPLGKLGDIELHMLHYTDETEAKAKWERRKKRMNWDNLFVKMSGPKHLDLELLKTFDDLDYKNKLIFLEKDNVELKNKVLFPDYSTNREMNHYGKYFDFVTWLNTGRLLQANIK